VKKNCKKSLKKYLRKIPDSIIRKVNNFLKDEVIVSAICKIPESNIKKGLYNHLKIELFDNSVKCESSILPKMTNGKWSRFNIFGKMIIRHDLPMITKTYYWDVPNFGDWSKGSHTVSIERLVYQRSLIPPKQLPIKIELIGEETTREKMYVFKFTVDEVLDRLSPDFKEQLFYNLNLLQENTGVHGIFQSDATIEEYLSTIYVNWEILPPGERDSNIAYIVGGIKNPDNKQKKSIIERYDFLSLLQPQAFVSGNSGFSRYFGAKFANDLVVFENVEYGNAIYIMGENWEELSKLSRTELLSKAQHGFIRITHNNYWRKRLQDEINKFRNGKAA
jgi:hypothetical protein